MRGRGGLNGYKDRADQFICSVLPRWISPSSSVGRTKGGLLFFDGNINMQYVASSTFLLVNYAKHLTASRQALYCGGKKVTAGQLYGEARRQVWISPIMYFVSRDDSVKYFFKIAQCRQYHPFNLVSFCLVQADYILGANPRGMSYMIGFGRNPIRVHHRAASLPSVRSHRWNIQCKQGFDWFNTWNANPNQATGAIIGGPDWSDNINDSRGNYAQMEPTTYTNAPMVGVFAAFAAGTRYY